jgi:radical SAM superfamily enzyme YgiQ (UPF0313 family)
MMKLKTDRPQSNHLSQNKILLILMPFWDPQIPPVGISSLKSFTREYGYKVKCVDANTNKEFREIGNKYFEIIKKYIPGDKRRHLLNTGHDVLRNHAMAHMNRQNHDKETYTALVKKVIYTTFYCNFDIQLVCELDQVITEFYASLEKYVLHWLEREKPAVLGLSVYSGTLPASLFAFKLAKEKYPSIQTVMGGGIFAGELSIETPNFQPFVKNTPYIDKIIVGEGERLFLKLLRGELSQSQKVFTLEDIDKQMVDISSTALLDFSDFDLQYYTQMANYTSRSCPFQCNFCVETVYWGKYRKKSGRQIFEELSNLYETYGHQLFLMCDCLLNPVVQDLADEFINSRLSLYWGGYLRVDPRVCDIENTLHWRRGGFYRARLGVESGSQSILNAMGKKIDVEQIKLAIYSLASAGIKTTTYWVIGYPGETENDFRKTLDLIEKLKNDIYEADCNPFWYFGGGQVNSNQWNKKNKSIPLFPGKALDMLTLQTWALDSEPSREERYERVNRFIEHCQRLEIPNPYSLDEIYKADERWKSIHKNAVPPLVKFQDRSDYINECEEVKHLVFAENKLLPDENWVF